MTSMSSKKFQKRLEEMRIQHLMVLDKQLDLLYNLPLIISEYNFRDRLNMIKMTLEIMDKKEKLLQDIKNVPKIVKKKSRV